MEHATTHIPPTADQLMARAAELGPWLLELHEEHERLGGLRRDVHEAIGSAGLYRVLHPRRFGGVEADLETFLRVGIELSRADPAVGWSWVLCGAHVFHVASLFPEAAQVELLDGRDLVAPLPIRPTGSAESVPGGYRLRGTWPYCSGSPWSTDALLPAVVDVARSAPSGPSVRLFAVPRSDYEVLEDWGGAATLGMAASGSNSIRVVDAVVPEHRSVPYELLLDGPADPASSPGFALHGNPMYLGRTAMFFAAELAASQVGAALAAVDEYETMMRTRTTSFPPVVAWIDSDDHHRRYGTIRGLAGSANELLLAAARRHRERSHSWAQGGEPFTHADDLGLQAMVHQAARLAGEAVDLAFTSAGTSAGFRGSRLAKYLRDVSMYRTHILAQLDFTAVAYSRAHLGAPRASLY